METIANAECECVASGMAVVTVSGTKDGSSEIEKREHRIAKCREYYRKHKEQCCAANKARHAERMKDPVYKKKYLEKSKERYYKRGKSLREERFKDPEYKKQYLAKCRAYYNAHKEEINTDERRKRLRERYRDRYSDPEYREKYVEKRKEYYILHREEISERRKKQRKIKAENIDEKIKVIEKRIQNRLESIDELKKELQDLNNMYNKQK